MGISKRWATAALTVGLAATAACSPAAGPGADPSPSESPSQSSTAPVEVTRVVFGVWGTREEIDAYREAAEAYNVSSDLTEVVVRRYPDANAIAEAVASDVDEPDVFLLTRDELAGLETEDHVRPAGELLDERNVDFGDGFSRGALEAFSRDAQLVCMPYGVYPQVVYVNTDLVDLTAMSEEGLDVPIDANGTPRHARWTFDQFSAAAQYASRPRGTKGVHVDPTLTGLSPFIYSGGGTVYDDPRMPTSLAFSSDDTRDVLDQVLPLLRDPEVTLTVKQLRRASPVEWFERGRLGMLIGDRRLLPELRASDGLNFDVWPMPRVDGPATVGEFTGACLSSGDVTQVNRAVDFLVDLTSQKQVARVAESGYLQPARLDVAHSPAFLQPGRLPAHPDVFASSVRPIEDEPLLPVRDDLERTIRPALRDLLLTPVLDLEEITERIDGLSAEVLAPEDEETTDEPSEGQESEGAEGSEASEDPDGSGG